MKTNLKKIGRLYTNMTLPVKASMWYLACSVLQKAIGFLTTPIFTRVMGISDFGVVSMYNSWEAIFTVFCTLYLYSYLFLIDQNDIPVEKIMSITIKNIIGLDRPITPDKCP